MEVKKTPDSMRVDVLYANGSRRRVVIPSGVISFVKQSAISRPYLFHGVGFSPLDADVASIVAVTRADHDISYGYSRSHHQTAFRLGQMDMQASIADMLENLAAGTQSEAFAALINAAQRVRNMEVPIENP